MQQALDRATTRAKRSRPFDQAICAQIMRSKGGPDGLGGSAIETLVLIGMCVRSEKLGYCAKCALNQKCARLAAAARTENIRASVSRLLPGNAD